MCLYNSTFVNELVDTYKDDGGAGVMCLHNSSLVNELVDIYKDDGGACL